MRAPMITALVFVTSACATAVPRPDDSSTARPVTAQWVERTGVLFRFRLSDPAHVRIYHVPAGSEGYTGEVVPVASGRFARGVSAIRRSDRAWSQSVPSDAYLLVASRAPFADEKPSAPTVEGILTAVLPEQDASGWDADLTVIPRVGLPREIAAEPSWMAREVRYQFCAERRASRTSSSHDPLCSFPYFR